MYRAKGLREDLVVMVTGDHGVYFDETRGTLLSTSTLLYPVLSCPTLPLLYRTLPYSTLSCPTLPLLYRTLPYPTYPTSTLSSTKSSTMYVVEVHR